jgi:hypothetical protein
MNARTPRIAGWLLALMAAVGPPAGLAAPKAGNPHADAYRRAIREGAVERILPKVASGRRSASAGVELEALATALAAETSRSAEVFDALRQGQSLSSIEAAELLWRIAVHQGLTDPLASRAGDLLENEDPFTRALAEWAIATRVGMDNNGQQIAWPRPDPPPWFQRWNALDPEFFVAADYVRFAVVCGIHDDADKLAASAKAILLRAQAATEAIRCSASAERRAMSGRQLEKLEQLQTRIAACAKASPVDLAECRRLWLQVRQAARPIVLANPAVDFAEIVFTKRHAAHSHRNITGSQYPWVHKPGGDIYVLTGLGRQTALRPVIQGQLGPGHVHGMDLWWDADRVVFAYARQPRWPPKWDAVHGDCSFQLRRDQEPTHLYEISLTGSDLRQLTNDPVWSDFEPTCTANGDVVFASDRSGRSSECGKFSADHTVINLYRLSADGKTLRRLSDNKDIDRYPHSLDNGLIGYTRWEYQERHFMEVHSIWTVRPDGTMSDALFKQHLSAPLSLRDTRSIPGTSKLVAVATGHHTFAYGPIVVVDPAVGLNSAQAIRVVTPQVVPQEGPMAGRPVDEGGVPDQGGLYQTPWALSEKCFLASYSYGRPRSDTAGGTNENGFALYLIDVYGNKELIHRDRFLSCDFPMPLRKRPRPPLLPDLTTAQSPTATCYVADVYHQLDGIPRGTIKYLRIAQRVGWPLDEDRGAMRYIPGNAFASQFGYWEWAPVRVLGTVRVESDGSAHFTVPVDAAVYFQALDENYMEVRRMRSHVTFQPGEVRGCIGCHETRMATPRSQWRASLALGRPAESPAPPSWGAARLLGYEWMIQPVLDRHCVRCHGSRKPEGDLDLTGTLAADGFLRSFGSLFGRAPGGKKLRPPLVSVSNRFSGAAVTKPKEFGSHRSRLIQVLQQDDLHRKEVKLNPDEWIALVTWIDANAPYHDRFLNKRPSDQGSPRREIALEQAASHAAP